MPQPPILTGQVIAEAEGALTRLLEHSLAATGVSRQEYIVLRVLALRGPYASARDLHDYLASQPQVGLTAEAAVQLVASLEAQGLARGTAPGSPGPAEATPEGEARLAQLTEAVAPRTRALFAGLDPDELAIARNVLAQLTTRATELTSRP